VCFRENFRDQCSSLVNATDNQDFSPFWPKSIRNMVKTGHDRSQSYDSFDIDLQTNPISLVDMISTPACSSLMWIF